MPIMYGYDNYTNTGINAAFQVNKNWMVQVGVVDGAEVALWVPRSHDPVFAADVIWHFWPTRSRR